MDKYSWTESGKWLLAHFQSLITIHGGNKALARKIEWDEAPEFFGGFKKEPRIAVYTITMDSSNKRPYSKEDDKFILDNWFDLSLKEIADHLNRKDVAISRRGRRLGFLSKPMVLPKKGGTWKAA